MKLQCIRIISLAGITCDKEKNDDTDNVFEQIFEKVKYFRKVFKYKYFVFLNYKYLKKVFKYFQIQMYLTPM